MKNITLVLGILLAFACSKTTENSATIIPSNPTLTTLTPAPKFIINNFTITNFSIPNITGAQIQIGVNGSISGTILYSKDNILNLVIPATLLMLAVFTTHLTIVTFQDGGNSGNCGCFGSLLPMTPIEAILKNVVAMVLLVILLKVMPKKDESKSNFWKRSGNYYFIWCI